MLADAILILCISVFTALLAEGNVEFNMLVNFIVDSMFLC